jgi:ABC-type sulfate transport system permease component
MNPRQIVIFIAGVFFIIGSVLPKPIIERATKKPFENQLVVRLFLAALGVIMILTVRTVA